MGVSNFLPDLIKSQGRLIDLRDFSSLRIAIDVSTWIYNATQKHGYLLGDERHLSNFGRAALMFQQEATEEEFIEKEALEKEKTLQEFIAKSAQEVIQRLQRLQDATKSTLLVVLDGQTPPIKSSTTNKRRKKRTAIEMERDRPADPCGEGSPQVESRYKANRQAGAGKHYNTVVNAIIKGLRECEIPFLVAPYESDAQLAYLQNKRWVDLIITEDSDLVAYGMQVPVLYKLQPSKKDGVMTQGVLIRREDLGALVPHEDPIKFNLLDFSPCLLAALFAASGCDYCPNLKGIGVGKACTGVREAFLQKKREVDGPPLERLFRKLVMSSYATSMTDEEQRHYREGFLKGLFMFRHAIVYDPLRRQQCHLTPLSDADPEFMSYGPYRALVQNTNSHGDIIGDILKDTTLATFIAEGWINPREMTARSTMEVPPDAVKEALIEYLRSSSQTDDGDDSVGGPFQTPIRRNDLGQSRG